MTKRLEELFNIDGEADLDHDEDDAATDETDATEAPSDEGADEEQVTEVVQISDAIAISDKINNALEAVHNIDGHDDEMDDIAKEAMTSYKDLMDLGMNVADMAAGSVLTNASQMLKIALEAKDAKVSRKLKQVDLMLKKARLDQLEKKNKPVEDTFAPLDRNELLKMLLNKDKAKE